VASGALGTLHALDLTFHNAYGPGQPWYYRKAESGGGCLLDLGIHLLDLLALWVPEPFTIRAAALSSKGRPWAESPSGVEDFALVQLQSLSGVVARVACSWGTPSGCDAVIEARLFGTRAGARIANVSGSFYDFTAEHLESGRSIPLAQPPDDWGGRAAVAWVDALAASRRFDPEAERLVELSALIDRCYETSVQTVGRQLRRPRARGEPIADRPGSGDGQPDARR
jgi:predicted dehydrogenase